MNAVGGRLGGRQIYGPGFICNLLLVRQEFIEKQPEVVRDLVQGAVRSGLWARKNSAEAAEIASRYWGQPVDLVKYALKTPEDRIEFDKYMPIEAELQKMADLMVRFKLIETSVITGLVEDRFAREANLEGIGGVDSILAD